MCRHREPRPQAACASHSLVFTDHVCAAVAKVTVVSALCRSCPPAPLEDVQLNHVEMRRQPRASTPWRLLLLLLLLTIVVLVLVIITLVVAARGMYDLDFKVNQVKETLDSMSPAASSQVSDKVIWSSPSFGFYTTYHSIQMFH